MIHFCGERVSLVRVRRSSRAGSRLTRYTKDAIIGRKSAASQIHACQYLIVPAGRKSMAPMKRMPSTSLMMDVMTGFTLPMFDTAFLF